MHVYALWERNQSNNKMRKIPLRGRGQGVTHLEEGRKEDIVGKEKIAKGQ